MNKESLPTIETTGPPQDCMSLFGHSVDAKQFAFGIATLSFGIFYAAVAVIQQVGKLTSGSALGIGDVAPVSLTILILSILFMILALVAAATPVFSSFPMVPAYSSILFGMLIFQMSLLTSPTNEVIIVSVPIFSFVIFYLACKMAANTAGPLAGISANVTKQQQIFGLLMLTLEILVISLVRTVLWTNVIGLVVIVFSLGYVGAVAFANVPENKMIVAAVIFAEIIALSHTSLSLVIGTEIVLGAAIVLTTEWYLQ